MDPMASITETDYFITGTRVHGVRIRASIRLLRRRWRRRLLMAQMHREFADPRCIADFGIEDGGDVYNKTATAMARALGGL